MFCYTLVNSVKTSHLTNKQTKNLIKFKIQQRLELRHFHSNWAIKSNILKALPFASNYNLPNQKAMQILEGTSLRKSVVPWRCEKNTYGSFKLSRAAHFITFFLMVVTDVTECAVEVHAALTTMRLRCTYNVQLSSPVCTSARVVISVHSAIELTVQTMQPEVGHFTSYLAVHFSVDNGLNQLTKQSS